MASLRSYEEVNGPVRDGPIFDANGLACQVSSSSNSSSNNMPPPLEAQSMMSSNIPLLEVQSMMDLDHDIMVTTTSNVMPSIANQLFREEAEQAALARRQQGYNSDGSPTGPYSQEHPPPGKTFNSYGKGCTHINWKNIGPSISLLNRLFSDILPNGDVDTLRGLLSTQSIGVNVRLGKGPTSKHTMLHWCVSRNQCAMVELLLEFNADTTLTEMKGRTAKDLAVKESAACLDLF